MDNDNFLFLIEQGNDLYDKSLFREAIVFFDKAIERNPRSELGWFEKGRSLDALNQYNDAIACYNKTVEIDPFHYYALYNIGTCLMILGKYSDSLEYFERSIQLNPKYFSAFLNKGSCYLHLHQLEEAETCFDSCILIDPQNPQGWTNKAAVSLQLKKYEDALDLVDKALTLNPRHDTAWSVKASCFMDLGKNEEALFCLNKLLAINPSDESAWINKGIILEEMDKINEAQVCFSKVPDIEQKLAVIHAKHQGLAGREFRLQNPNTRILAERYAIEERIGTGGFGIVYKVFDIKFNEIVAFKTFRDDYFANQKIKEKFKEEAYIWIHFNRHPNIVTAKNIFEIDERLYIKLEYIPKNDAGLNTLEHYLTKNPPDFHQALIWAIQFCAGMEHAFKHGLNSHRDIKPSNILITPEKVLKITDFGLATILSDSNQERMIELTVVNQKIGLSKSLTMGKGFGTPTHMPPEQFENALACDERSDIYSFGVVLYQMINGGRLPFLAPLPRNASENEHIRFWKEMYHLHKYSIPVKVPTPLFPIIEKCLQKAPKDRYQHFSELRSTIESVYLHSFGNSSGSAKVPENGYADMINKGVSLMELEKYDEAIEYFDRCIALEEENKFPWINKSETYRRMGKPEEALYCIERSIKIDPSYAKAWDNKVIILNSLSRLEEALQCSDRTIQINPYMASAWVNKSNVLKRLKLHKEAIECCDTAIRINPECIPAYANKALLLIDLCKYSEALELCNEVLRISPYHSGIWGIKTMCHTLLGQRKESEESYKKFQTFKKK